MPKVGRYSIGYQRPKKKKVEQSAEVEEVSDNMEDEEEPSAAPPVPPDDMVDITDLRARIALTVASTQATLDEGKEAEQLEQNVEKARHQHEVVNRRWRKTMLHYFKDNPTLRWATDSEFQRALDRMQDIDDEHDASEDHVIACENENSCHRRWRKLKRRQTLGGYGVEDADIEEAARELAAARASHGVARERPERKMHGGQVLELIARHAGMAQAFQWVSLSELR